MTAPLHVSSRALHASCTGNAAAAPTLSDDVRLRSGTWTASSDRALRVNGRLHYISVGRTHAHQRVILLLQVHDIRIVDPSTG